MQPTRTSIRVLCIDSDPESAAHISDILEREDSRFAVESATNAGDGLDHLEQGTPDCIVSGYELPEQNAIEFLESIRENYPDLPFILYTENGNEQVASDAISAGVTEYLQRDPTNENVGIVATRIANVVDEHRTGEEAGAGQDRLEQILKTVPGCVVKLDTTGRFTYANQRAEDVLGLERSAVTERTYDDPEWNITDLDGNPIPEEELPFRRVLDTGESLYGLQHRIQWPDGSEKILQVNGAPLFDDHGDVESLVFSLTDITERKKREQRQERYKAFLEHSPVAIAVVDESGEITYQSPASERVVGTSADELTGELAFEYLHPEDRTDVVELFSELIEDSDGSRTAEYRLEDGDGNWRWVQSTATNYLDEPAIDGIVIASVDVTERKEYEQRIEEQRDNLETVNEVVRHDIRNDLQLVTAYVDLLAEHVDEGSDRHEYAEKIQESAGQAVELTRKAREMTDVMLTSEDDRGEVRLRNSLTTELDEVRAAYPEAIITVEGDIPAVDVLADEMLGSVFRNLLINAVQHNDKPVPEVTVVVENRTDTVRVRVADNGPGVPDEQREDIFGKGEKGLNSEGTGIGLYLVQTLVEGYDGDVRVTDNDPEGALFVVELPVAT